MLNQCLEETLSRWACHLPRRSAGNFLSREMLRETSYNTKELQCFVTQNEAILVPDQRVAYKTIADSIMKEEGKIMFLDAPGGTGKTFLINLILTRVRSQGKIAVASSGIAATLLPGGRTAHSAFKLPLNLNTTDSPVCNISKGTGAADVLKKCNLIVWDECTMAHIDREMRTPTMHRK